MVHNQHTTVTYTFLQLYLMLFIGLFSATGYAVSDWLCRL